MSAGPENGRLLNEAIYWARRARGALESGALDRMLASQLAAELAPPPAGWGFERGAESQARALEVAELLPVALRSSGQ